MCNEKHNPSYQIQSIYGCFDCARKINNQINWKEEVKQNTWLSIVKCKIKVQNECLSIINLDPINNFDYYESKLIIDDPNNIEGIIAKIYFHKLFGIDFNRRIDNDINAMLNYGYSILLSFFNREIITNGYLTQIGLHHSNKTNPYNLSSDLMEPFRPYVDRIVYENKKSSLTMEMKQILISVFYHYCFYNNRKMLLINAIPLYIKEVFDVLEDENKSLGAIRYV